MAAHHGFLHRVQRAVGFFQTLHRLDRFAIQSGQQLDTAVHGHVVHARASVVELAHHHHTRTAIALGAALFGALAVQLLTQVIQNGGGAAHTLGFDDLAVEHKSHGVGDLGHGGGGKELKKVRQILVTCTPNSRQVCRLVYK